MNNSKSLDLTIVDLSAQKSELKLGKKCESGSAE